MNVSFRPSCRPLATLHASREGGMMEVNGEGGRDGKTDGMTDKGSDGRMDGLTKGGRDE